MALHSVPYLLVLGFLMKYSFDLYGSQLRAVISDCHAVAHLFFVDPEGPFASSEVLARVDTNPYGNLCSEPGRALIRSQSQLNLHSQINGYKH